MYSGVLTLLSWEQQKGYLTIRGKHQTPFKVHIIDLK